MTGLSHPIISVQKGGEFSYGGSQRWSENAALQKAGCGVIAAADLLYYLALYHPNCATPFTGTPADNIVPFCHYERLCQRLRKSYLPVIPNFGKTGPALSLGINAIFSQYRLPFHATWCVSSDKLFERIGEMLGNDIPVIFSIGQNFPAFWGKERVTLYKKSPEGPLIPAAGTKAHYVTVTGLDEEYLRVSSWGREYYIRRREYTDYVRLYSSSISSNILYIKKLHS